MQYMHPWCGRRSCLGARRAERGIQEQSRSFFDRGYCRLYEYWELIRLGMSIDPLESRISFVDFHLFFCTTATSLRTIEERTIASPSFPTSILSSLSKCTLRGGHFNLRLVQRKQKKLTFSNNIPCLGGGGGVSFMT